MHFRTIQFVFFVICLISSFCNVRAEDSQDEIIENLFKDYSKREYPPGKATELRVGVYINSVEINTSDMNFKIGFYLRQAWKDERLKFDSSIEKLYLLPDDIDKMFIPDVFFRNGDAGTMGSEAKDNTLLTVNQTGHVWFVRKLSVTLFCPMKLQKYPFDTQMCPLMFESFSATMDKLYLNWLDSPVDIDPVIQLPGFSLTDIILFDCSKNYSSGAFPCLETRFVLRRDTGFYIMQAFVPGAFAVILSWFAFWGKIEWGFQVLLEVILLAGNAALSIRINQFLPPVSYVKCIDIWFSVCNIFILAALVVCLLLQCKKDSSGESKRCGGRRITERLARLLFPIFFLIFIIIFSVLYTLPSPPGSG